MIKVVAAIFLFCTVVQADEQVGLINSVKSKKLMFGKYLNKKLQKSPKIIPLEFNDFPKQVRDLYKDFNKDLPQGYLADFNQDGKKDLVFMSKYKGVSKEKPDTVVYAAISTKSNKYKVKKVFKFKSLSIGDTKLSKYKKDKDSNSLNYMSDPEPGKLANKPVVIETYLAHSIRFKYDGRKFSKIDKNGKIIK